MQSLSELIDKARTRTDHNFGSGGDWSMLAIVAWLGERGVVVYYSTDPSIKVWKARHRKHVAYLHAATDFRTAVLAAFDRELDSLAARRAPDAAERGGG